jgi:osmotically-inducible protein OsmY
MAALHRNVTIDATTLNVKVKKGLVTLSGTAPSPAVCVAARLAAYHTDGVTDVVDNLRFVGREDSNEQ